jgi:hypothetical protein
MQQLALVQSQRNAPPRAGQFHAPQLEFMHANCVRARPADSG